MANRMSFVILPALVLLAFSTFIKAQTFSESSQCTSGCCNGNTGNCGSDRITAAQMCAYLLAMQLQNADVREHPFATQPFGGRHARKANGYLQNTPLKDQPYVI